MVIAALGERAVGVMPWRIDGQTVHLGFTCVAPDQRRKGIGSGLASTGRVRFPRDDGWEIRTSEAITPLMADHLWRDGKDERREGWFDFTGVAAMDDFATPQIMDALSEAQANLDSLLSDD